MRLSIQSLIKPFGIFFLLGPVFFFGFNSSAYAEENSNNVTSKAKVATKSDTFLYRQIGVNILCRARLAEIEFPKAIGISAATFADVILQKHDGRVEEMPGTKLNAKQLYLSAEVQIIEGAIKFCPDSVPKEAKDKFNDFVELQNNNIKKKNKKK